jgi:hypothetical protein
MNDPSSYKREEVGYRKGVLLGLTVAEIILLMLFALLIALWAQLSILRSDSERAKAIISRFSDVIKRADNKSDSELAKEVEKILQVEIDYSAKLAQELVRYKENLLPDDVFELIKSLKLDLNKLEDRERLRDLIKISTEFSTTSNSSTEQLADQCQVGGMVTKRLKGVDPERLFSDLDHWKSVAASCGKSNVLPSCYQLNGKDVFIFEVRLNDKGILIKKTIPVELENTFQKHFSSQPTYGITLSKNEFRDQTMPFVKHGREKECRFNVNAYDDTGVDKKYFQEVEKLLDSVFRKRKHW